MLCALYALRVYIYTVHLYVCFGITVLCTGKVRPFVSGRVPHLEVALVLVESPDCSAPSPHGVHRKIG